MTFSFLKITTPHFLGKNRNFGYCKNIYWDDHENIFPHKMNLVCYHTKRMDVLLLVHSRPKPFSIIIEPNFSVKHEGFIFVNKCRPIFEVSNFTRSCNNIMYFINENFNSKVMSMYRLLPIYCSHSTTFQVRFIMKNILLSYGFFSLLKRLESLRFVKIESLRFVKNKALNFYERNKVISSWILFCAVYTYSHGLPCLKDVPSLLIYRKHTKLFVGHMTSRLLKKTELPVLL